MGPYRQGCGSTSTYRTGGNATVLFAGQRSLPQVCSLSTSYPQMIWARLAALPTIRATACEISAVWEPAREPKIESPPNTLRRYTSFIAWIPLGACRSRRLRAGRPAFDELALGAAALLRLPGLGRRAF